MSSFVDFLDAELWAAYLDARKGKRKTMDEHRFELNEGANLRSLRQDFLQRTYRPGDPIWPKAPSSSFVCGE